MLMDPLPSICKVYSLLVQQERQANLPIDESKILVTPSSDQHHCDTQSKSYSNMYGRGSTRGGRSSGGKGRNNRVCTQCGMSNHTIDTCFKKHGYPPHWKHEGAINQCNTASDRPENTSGSDIEASAPASHGLAFTSEQHQALLALLQGSSHLQSHTTNQLTSQTNLGSGTICIIPNSFHAASFILDTRATDHVCFTREYFQCLKQIKPIILKLPNGSLVTTNLSGTIQFNSNFYITDVLYLPNFAFNLISVTKLTKLLNCQLVFNDNSCTVQDKFSLKMIGTTELHGGLYLLTSPSVTLPKTPPIHCINSSVNNSNSHYPECSLWHIRLGHASNSKLIELNKDFPFIKPVNIKLPCDVCFYAKQKRMPFSPSSYASQSTFDILHMDIWGPLAIPSMMGYRYFLTIVYDKSRFTWMYLMRLKSETTSHVKSFVTLVKTQFNCHVKCIRSDNGNEFLMPDFYNQ